MRPKVVAKFQGKLEGPCDGPGAVFAWFARFLTMLVDAALERDESARTGRGMARLLAEIGRSLHAFMRYCGCIWIHCFFRQECGLSFSFDLKPHVFVNGS
jgi:hypothetical protein